MGTRRSGSGCPTIKDVARLAGVSTATASRVVRGEDHVRPEKIEAVERAVRQLGYVPNSAARGLVERRVGAIALVFPELEGRVFADPFFGAVVSGVSSALEGTDLQMLLVMTGRDSSGERMRRFVRGNHCDGMILASQHEKSELGRALDERTVPAVSIGRPTRGHEMPHVDLDNMAGGRLAAEHLLDRGYRRIAIISGPSDMSAGIEREQGFREVLSDRGISPVRVVHGDYSFASGVEAFEELAADGIDFDVVFAVNDLMALAACQRLRMRALRIPEDVAVMGFDNIDLARAEANELTTVNNPVIAMAQGAVESLLTLIDGGEVPERDVREAELVVRRSA